MVNVETIIEQMTLEEKARLYTGGSMATTVAIGRLGVPETLITDGWIPVV